MTATYLYPGVYLQEVASGVHPIEGVPTSNGLGVYLQEVPSGVHSIDGVPTWPDANAHDPGLTLIELVAYLGDSLQYRSGAVPRHAPDAPHQLLEHARHGDDSAVIRHKP